MRLYSYTNKNLMESFPRPNDQTENQDNVPQGMESERPKNYLSNTYQSIIITNEII